MPQSSASLNMKAAGLAFIDVFHILGRISETISKKFSDDAPRTTGSASSFHSANTLPSFSRIGCLLVSCATGCIVVLYMLAYVVTLCSLGLSRRRTVS